MVALLLLSEKFEGRAEGGFKGRGPTELNVF